METMHATDNALQPTTLLLEQLYHLYTAERRFALELGELFRDSYSIPRRLTISDCRKETARQILRLERMIQMTTGATASSAPASMTTLQPLAGDPDEPSLAFDAPLRAVKASILAYGAAISTANALGETGVAELLAESLNEKSDACVALSKPVIELPQ
jgi:ferritin-like metal-binding protein YciE